MARPATARNRNKERKAPDKGNGKEALHTQATKHINCIYHYWYTHTHKQRRNPLTWRVNKNGAIQELSTSVLPAQPRRSASTPIWDSHRSLTRGPTDAIMAGKHSGACPRPQSRGRSASARVSSFTHFPKSKNQSRASSSGCRCGCSR